MGQCPFYSNRLFRLIYETIKCSSSTLDTKSNSSETFSVQNSTRNLPRASPLLSLLDLPGKPSLVKQDSTVSIVTEQQVIFITKYGHGSRTTREKKLRGVQIRSDVRRFTLRPRRSENVPTDRDNNLQPLYRQIAAVGSRCTETLERNGSRNSAKGSLEHMRDG